MQDPERQDCLNNSFPARSWSRSRGPCCLSVWPLSSSAVMSISIKSRCLISLTGCLIAQHMQHKGAKLTHCQVVGMPADSSSLSCCSSCCFPLLQSSPPKVAFYICHLKPLIKNTCQDECSAHHLPLAGHHHRDGSRLLCHGARACHGAARVQVGQSPAEGFA